MSCAKTASNFTHRQASYYHVLPVLGLQFLAIELAAGVMPSLEVEYFGEDSVIIVGMVR